MREEWVDAAEDGAPSIVLDPDSDQGKKEKNEKSRRLPCYSGKVTDFRARCGIHQGKPRKHLMILTMLKSVPRLAAVSLVPVPLRLHSISYLHFDSCYSIEISFAPRSFD